MLLAVGAWGNLIFSLLNTANIELQRKVKVLEEKQFCKLILKKIFQKPFFRNHFSEIHYIHNISLIFTGAYNWKDFCN